MRIRKRKVPLPFSSLSPIPLTDPCFARFMPPLQQYLFAADSPPPDQPIHLAAPPISPAAGDTDRVKIIITDDEEGRNHSRGKGIVGAHVVALPHRSLPTSSSSSSSFLGRDQEKAFIPVKKRSTWGGISEVTIGMINPVVKQEEPAAGAEINADDQQEDDNNDDEKEGRKSGNDNIIESRTGTSSSSSSAAAAAGALILSRKMRGRGGGAVLMEGSRCSRVNGRGWRCCQPTLVGYSLCEHHLGKGRLRSMTTSSTTAGARVGASTAQKNKDDHQKLHHRRRPASVVEETRTTSANGISTSHDQKDQEEDEELMMMIAKQPPPRRRSSSQATKLGMVKARSISSLLHQTTSMVDTKKHHPDHLPFFSGQDVQLQQKSFI